MPNIIVHPAEKTILMHYMSNPLGYIDEKYHHYFPQNKCLEQTKVTRGFDSDEHIRRYFRVPLNLNDSTYVIIPFSRVDNNDPLEHSCTFVGNKYFFHQNEYDLPKVKCKDIVSVSASDSDSSDSENEHQHTTEIEQTEIQRQHVESLRFKEYFHQLRLARALQKNYLKNQSDQQMLQCVVKFAVDENDRDYILKSTSSFIEEYISIQPKSLNQVDHFRFYRQTSIDGYLRIKRIDIQPYYGKNLFEFLSTYNVTESMKNNIIHEMLAQYVQQIYKTNLVHTDINPSNICIQIVDDKIQLRYIDDDESFTIDTDTSERKGKGTPGYYAPEFFIDSESYRHQLDIRALGEQDLVEVLKPNFRNLFSQATDVYALGHCILNNLSLPVDSPYYGLIQRMCDMNPDARPTGEEIQSMLDEIAALRDEESSLPLILPSHKP